MIYVLTYGTLMPKCGGLQFMEDSLGIPFEAVSIVDPDAQVHGYKMYDCGRYPCIVPSDNLDDIIKGQLILLDSEKYLEALDMYEGCNEEGTGLYKRVDLVPMVQASEAKIYIYEFNRPIDGFLSIKSGDWYEHTVTKKEAWANLMQRSGSKN